LARRRASSDDGLTFRSADTLFGLFNADFVALTTFCFDPVYFEKRLLRTKALERASRIVVFMDEREWGKVQRRGDPVRHLNTRYLVVPVSRSLGVFHPKLVLLLGQDGIAAGCHSANLTRPGYGHNLELLNYLSSSTEKPDQDALALARQTLECMQRISATVSETTAGIIAHEWLVALASEVANSREIMDAESDIELWDTLNAPIWDRLTAKWTANRPDELAILSPFYDHDHRLLARVSEALPGVPIRIIAQNRTSTFDPKPLAGFPSPLSLTTVGSPRRLHAKAIMWRHGTRWSSLCGSANWTVAAMDGLNVEASVLIPDAVAPDDLLADQRLNPELIDLAEFEPGGYEPPEAECHETPDLLLAGAVLDGGRSIRVEAKNRSGHDLMEPTLDVWVGHESQPRASLRTTMTSQRAFTATCPEGLDLGSSLRVSLRATAGGDLLVSPAIWVIKRDRLEHDSEGGASSSRQRQIRENGEGLEDHLDEIATTAGPSAVAEYLRSLSIRFHAGERTTISNRAAVRLQAKDPFRGAETPDWWLGLTEGQGDLRDAIDDFVDRHYRKHLRRHAKSGNINGIENFVDVLSCLVRLLYRWRERTRARPLDDQIVTGGQIIGRYCAFITVMLDGVDSGKEKSPGYIAVMKEMMRGDFDRLIKRIEEASLIPIAFALLRLAQVERASRESRPTSPHCVLTDWTRRITAFAESLGFDVEIEQAVRIGLGRLAIVETGLKHKPAESGGPLKID
jgi:hypothetical protein